MAVQTESLPAFFCAVTQIWRFCADELMVLRQLLFEAVQNPFVSVRVHFDQNFQLPVSGRSAQQRLLSRAKTDEAAFLFQHGPHCRDFQKKGFVPPFAPFREQDQPCSFRVEFKSSFRVVIICFIFPDDLSLFQIVQTDRVKDHKGRPSFSGMDIHKFYTAVFFGPQVLFKFGDPWIKLVFLLPDLIQRIQIFLLRAPVRRHHGKTGQRAGVVSRYDKGIDSIRLYFADIKDISFRTIPGMR